MIKELRYIQAILEERFKDHDTKDGKNRLFSFSVGIDPKSRGDVWAVTFMFGEFCYQSKAQDQDRAYTIAVQSVLDDTRTKVKK